MIQGDTLVTARDGWFLTDDQLLDIDRDIRRIELLEKAVAARDSLIAISEQRIFFCHSILNEQHELIDELSDRKLPGLWGQTTDRGTLLAISIISTLGFVYGSR